MAKVLKVIGAVLGAVALVATGLGAFGVGAVLGAKTATIAAIAGIGSTAANIGSQLLARPPPARGSVTQVLIAADAPQPYVMGEGYCAGVLRHDCAYGAELNKVPNPYRFMAVVYSGGGPIQSITPYVDQGTVPTWYDTFLYTDTQLGACPESSALAPNFAGATGWDSTSKLSGQAAIGWNFKFDKDGKRFASGLPQLGAYGQWVKVYDPRLDSTFPGGSGSHRLGDETTYAWSENPALHAGTYAYGRFQNGKRTFGIGLPEEAIDWAQIADWANVCDDNAWTIYGVIYEPAPETRWPNLKDICAAGGCIPLFASGLLSFKYAAPKVALDTFTSADVVSQQGKATAQASWRERLNTIVPKFRSPDHNWELVASTVPVTVSSYVTEDGEVKQAEWPFNLVKDGDQAAQLAAYRLVDGRELQPIELTCGVRTRGYRPGDCVHLEVPELGLDHDAIIVRRQFDPESLSVNFTFMTETTGKHAFALGETATPPPTPALGQDGETRDNLSAATKDAAYELFNAQNDRNGDPIIDPTIPTGGSAVDHTVRNDGSVDLTFDFLWSGDNNDIDGFEVALYSSSSASAYTPGSDAANESRFIVPRDLRFYAVRGAPANAYYTWAVRAFRWVDPDIDATGVIRSAWVKSTESGENPYRPSSSLAFTGDYSGTIAGSVSTSTVATATTNFNSRNDRTATTPTAPAIPGGGTAIDHTANDNASVNISFEWTYSGSEVDIDFFEVMMRLSGSASAYTAGTTPAEETLITVPAHKRALFLYGVNPINYYTFAVRAVRTVDPDVNAAGRIASAWVQSAVSGENPYQPSSTAPFNGDITGTIDGVAAATVVSNAAAGAGLVSTVNNGLNADGTVKSTRVGTSAFVDNAAAALGAATTGTATVGGGMGSYIDVTGASVTITPDSTDSVFQVISNFTLVNSGVGDTTAYMANVPATGNPFQYVPMQATGGLDSNSSTIVTTVTGLTGSTTFKLRMQAETFVDCLSGATISVLEVKKAG